MMALLVLGRSIRGISAMVLLAAIVLVTFSERVSAQQNGPDKKNFAAVGPRNLLAASGLLSNKGPLPLGRISEVTGNVAEKIKPNPSGNAQKSEGEGKVEPTVPSPGPNKETPNPEAPKQVTNAPNKETPKPEAPKRAENALKEDKAPVDPASTKNNGPARKTEPSPVQTKRPLIPEIAAPVLDALRPNRGGNSQAPKETTSKPVARTVETSPILSQVVPPAVGSIISAAQKPPIAETLLPPAKDLLPPVVRNPPPIIEKPKFAERILHPSTSVPDPISSARTPQPRTASTPTVSARPPQSTTVPEPPVSTKPSQPSSSPAFSSTEVKGTSVPSRAPEVPSRSNQGIWSTDIVNNPVSIQERPSIGNQGMLSWDNPSINEDISHRSDEFRAIDNIRLNEIKKESGQSLKPMSQESESSSPKPSSAPKDTRNFSGGVFSDDAKDSDLHEKENASQAYTIFGGVAACVFVLASGAGGFYYYYKRNGQRNSELPPLEKSSTTFAEEAIQMVHIPYVPELDDELRLSVGDKVIIQERFQDSWVVGTNLTTGDSGCFPALCLDAEVAGSIASEIEGATSTSGSKSKRMRSHSLAAKPMGENTFTLNTNSASMIQSSS